MSRQDKYTRSARGQSCTVRIPGICTPAPENNTTILAHINGGGAGMKHSNIHGAYCCAECHRWLDGGWAHKATRKLRDLYHLQGMLRTQILMIQAGILKL